jgi:Family of unknown function (DUF6496)
VCGFATARMTGRTRRQTLPVVNPSRWVSGRTGWNRPTVITLADRCLIRTEVAMPKSSPRQRKTMGRVMHEFKHGELKSGPGGRAGKVKSRRQAVAIALKEAGASKYESEGENKRNLAKSKRKEARGDTYQQESEGKSHVGARGRRESSSAMGGKNATRTTARGRKSARARKGGTGTASPTSDE